MTDAKAPPNRETQVALLRGTRAALFWQLLLVDEPTLTAPSTLGAWSLKDLLAHLAYWDRWILAAMRAMVAGEKPDFRALARIDETNAAVVDEWRAQPLDRVVDELSLAREESIAWILGLGQAEYEQSRSYGGYDWTFSTCALGYQRQHEEEHLTQVAAWRKANKPTGDCGPGELLLAAILASRAEFLAALAVHEAMDDPPEQVCGVWNVRDVVGHLADWEMYGTKGLVAMAAGKDPPGDEDSGLEEWDLDAWNALHAEARRSQSFESVLEALCESGREMRAALAAFAQPALCGKHTFPWGEQGTPYQWALVYVQHDRDHAEDIRAACGIAPASAEEVSE